MERFKSYDGVEIAYSVFGTPSDLPPVVLHHGFLVDGLINWVGPGVVGALVAAGRYVVTIDARGHGASDKPDDPSAYVGPAMVQDLALLIARLGVSTVDLVGYSMGGVVALGYAAYAGGSASGSGGSTGGGHSGGGSTDGELASGGGLASGGAETVGSAGGGSGSTVVPVRRLVIGGIGAGVVEVGGIDTRVIPPDVLSEALLTPDPSTLTGSPAAFRMVADQMGADREAVAAVARALALSGESRRIDLSAVTVPTLVLCGRDDPLAVRPEVLAAALPSATLQVVPGDHLGAVRDPAFTPAILAFLATPWFP